MASAEHHPPDKIAEGDVGRRRNRPAARHRVIGVRPKKQGQPQIDGDRPQHPANGGDQRCRRLSAAQAAVFKDHRFPDFLGGDRKEKRHQDLVDKVMQCQRPICDDARGVITGLADEKLVHQDEIHKTVVTFGVDIGPDQRQQSPANEK